MAGYAYSSPVMKNTSKEEKTSPSAIGQKRNMAVSLCFDFLKEVNYDCEERKETRKTKRETK